MALSGWVIFVTSNVLDLATRAAAEDLGVSGVRKWSVEKKSLTL
jgi:hypothetical protein